MQTVTNIKERLTEFIEHKGLSQAKFERACSLANGFVNSIGKSIRGESLNKISVVFPELSRSWLLLGEGEMIKPSDTYSSQLDLINQRKLRPRSSHNFISAGRDNSGDFSPMSNTNSDTDPELLAELRYYKEENRRLNDLVNKKNEEIIELLRSK